MHAGLTIIEPDSPDAWAEARALVREYVTWLGVDLGFQDFDQEFASLDRHYGPSGACFLLARLDGASVGCAGLRRFSATEGELKRFYVQPAGRGRGIGRALATALIDRGRRIGYDALLLDTLAHMTPAQRLYESLGFVPTPPYRHNPLPDARYWRLALR
jgi:GNAT superfamily N-acetyltransferase